MAPVVRAGEPFRFVHLCDTQLGRGGYEHDLGTFREAVREINALEPAFTIICGDLVEERTDPQSYVDFLEIKDGFEAPCYLSPGNHDVGAVPTLADLKRYRETIGADYYTFDFADFTFLMTNTQLWRGDVADETAKHATWFKESLETARAQDRRIIVAGHYPPFVRDIDEKDNGMNIPKIARKELLELCEKNDVSLFLAGHLHMNNRSQYNGMPIIASAATSKNIRGPLGFRVWTVDEDGEMMDEYIALDLAETAPTR